MHFQYLHTAVLRLDNCADLRQPAVEMEGQPAKYTVGVISRKLQIGFMVDLFEARFP